MTAHREVPDAVEQLALDDLTDEELDEVFEYLHGPRREPGPLLGYARPATRAPFTVDPDRPVEDLPPLDDYCPPARTTVRNR